MHGWRNNAGSAVFIIPTHFLSSPHPLLPQCWIFIKLLRLIEIATHFIGIKGSACLSNIFPADRIMAATEVFRHAVLCPHGRRQDDAENVP